MREAIAVTERRRSVQIAHNEANGITPTTVSKAVADILGRLRSGSPATGSDSPKRLVLSDQELSAEVARLSKAMLEAAEEMRFEEAAVLRDEIHSLQRLGEDSLDLPFD
jgi:excinuclease ABC subunit B